MFRLPWPLVLLVLAKSLSGHSFVLCKGFCLKSAIFLSGNTFHLTAPFFSLISESFTAVVPSCEGRLISLGVSNHTVKVALVKVCPCFQTRKQPLWERQITWTWVDSSGKNGGDCLSARVQKSPDPGHTLPGVSVETAGMLSSPLLGCMILTSRCMEKENVQLEAQLNNVIGVSCGQKGKCALTVVTMVLSLTYIKQLGISAIWSFIGVVNIDIILPLMAQSGIRNQK